MPDFMSIAIKEAEKAAQRGEVPIGAVLIDKDGNILAQSGNSGEHDHDPTAHAEINVIRQATAKRRENRLPDCDLYVTLEPCPMCATAISFARIRRLYFGAFDPKGGGVDHGPKIFDQPTCHHKPEIYSGIDEKNCAALLKDFFTQRR